MAKPKNPESFDVAGTRYQQDEDPIALLVQAMADYRTPDPSSNFTHRISGDTLTLYLHCHERGLGDPGRRAAQIDAMQKGMDAYLKGLKRRYRELGGGTLELKEKKGGRGHKLDRVSMNDRWDIVYHRTFEVDLVRLPEE
jgi:hypothetical protein